MTIEQIQHTTEFQIFDRKSAKIDAKALAITIIAFATATIASWVRIYR